VKTVNMFDGGRPDLIAGKSPSATMLKGFSASIPASFSRVAPSSKIAALARVFFGQRCNYLPQLAFGGSNGD
jgi:hypothetical protein